MPRMLGGRRTPASPELTGRCFISGNFTPLILSKENNMENDIAYSAILR